MGKKTGSLRSNIYACYRRRARTRGLDFELTRNEFDLITMENCYICGAEPSNKRVSARSGAYHRYNGIDRLDNMKGYTKANAKACCWKCNNIKASMALVDLKRHLKKMITGLKEVA